MGRDNRGQGFVEKRVRAMRKPIIADRQTHRGDGALVHAGQIERFQTKGDKAPAKTEGRAQIDLPPQPQISLQGCQISLGYPL